MPFDPCGTRKLEGEEILKRLAEALEINPIDLKDVLKYQSMLSEAARLSKEKQQNNP